MNKRCTYYGQKGTYPERKRKRSSIFELQCESSIEFEHFTSTLILEGDVLGTSNDEQRGGRGQRG